MQQDRLMQPTKTIPTIGYAYGHASRHIGAGDGPKYVREHADTPLQLVWQDMIQPFKPEKQGDSAIEDVKAVCTQLAKRVHSTLEKYNKFLVIGGDHSCAIGTWHGVKQWLQGELGLIWIDAHMDSHTPDTSPSHNIHGMPLASLLGFGDERLTHLYHKNAVLDPKNTTVIGVSDYEPEEAALLKQLDIQTHFLKDLPNHDPFDTISEQITRLETQTSGFGISLDLDVFDPGLAPGVTTYAPGGIDVDRTLAALAKAAKSPKFMGLEIVEFTPANDLDNQTLKLIQQIISVTFDL